MKTSILIFFSLLILIGTSCHKENPTNLIYQSDFNSDNSAWSHSCSSTSCRRFSNGVYQLEVDIESDLASAFAPIGILNSPYFMSVDVAMHRDDPTKWGAVGFQYNFFDATNFKVFVISNNGYFGIFQFMYGKWTTLTDWTPSSAINVANDALNTITIKQMEQSVEFTVNGVSLGSFPYIQSYNFKLGLAVETASSTYFTRVTGSFDNLVIRKL